MNAESVQGRNYYEMLGVDKEASREEIKKAYRELSRIFHPDSHFFDDIVDNAVSEDDIDLYKQITSAYNTLSDEAERKSYDESLRGKAREWSDRQAGPARGSPSVSVGGFNSGREKPKIRAPRSVRSGANSRRVKNVSEVIAEKRMMRLQMILLGGGAFGVCVLGITLYFFSA